MSKEDSSGEGRSQDASSPDSPANISAKDPNAEIYENHGSKKIIRVLTVMAYLFSVSFVGILLSAYYIFLWEPPNPRLMQRERLRMDPQMQFLVAPSEETKKDSSFLLQSNPVHKLLLDRTAHHMYDGDDSVVDSQNKINLEKKRRLNAALLKLRHSLVDTLRAQKRNSSQETMNSSGFNNSFVEEVLNSTVSSAENTISVNQHGKSTSKNIFEEKTHSDIPIEFADSVSSLDVESTSSISRFRTIPEIKTSQRLDRDSVNPIVDKKKQYNKKSLNAVKSYIVRKFSNVTTNSDVRNDSNRRVFEEESSKMTQKFLKTDRKESMKQNETDDHRLINNDQKDDSDGVQTSIILEKFVNGSMRNFQENYSPNDQIEQIASDKVSIDSSSRDSGFTDNPGFHRISNDLTVVKSRPRTARNFEGEKIRVDLPSLSHGAGINRTARNVTV